MPKTNILFLMPTLWSGGTNSALSSLLNNVDKSKFDISVFVVAKSGRRVLPYQKYVLKKEWLISAFYGNLSKTSGWEKVQTYLVKTIKKICNVCRLDLETFVLKHTARKLERASNYDVVIAYMEGYTTKLGSYFRNPNKIAWLHCDYQRYMQGLSSEEKYYAKYNKIVGVSKQTTESIAQYYPNLSNRMSTIYNLIDTDRIIESSKKPVDDDRFITDGFTIISVGRITEVKRFSYIPQIARKLKEKQLKFKWYIIGPVHDEQEAKRLTSEISVNKVEDCCIWLGGKENPYPYYREADLFVCTSYSEACPMVFNEARLLNTPIVSTDFASSYEFINNGVDGIITSIDTIFQEIETLIKDKSLYEKLYNNTKSLHQNNADILKQFYDFVK